MASANVCKVLFALEGHPQISGLKTRISFLAHYSVFHSPLTTRVLGGGESLMNFSFHSQLESLYFGCPTPFSNSLFLKFQTLLWQSSSYCLFRFFPYPVDNIPILSPSIVTSFRFHLTGWLKLITLCRAGAEKEGGWARTSFSPVGNSEHSVVKSNFLPITPTKRSCIPNGLFTNWSIKVRKFPKIKLCLGISIV